MAEHEEEPNAKDPDCVGTKDEPSLEKQADILQATFKHYFDMAMDHHTKAATTSHILLIIVGAIITLVGLGGTTEQVGRVGGLAICLIGLFGAVWARKQHERYFYWQHIAYKYQDGLADIVPGFKTGYDYYNSAKEAAKCEGYGIINRIRDRWLWVSLHLIVFVVGLVLLYSYS